MRLILLLLLILAAHGAGPSDPAPLYRHPVIFCRAHTPEQMVSKIFIMEDDGSKLRQLTHGDSYDDHPSLYSDLRHVLYSEFGSKNFDRSTGAKLIRLDIYTGAREVVAEAAGCALHHAS